MSEALEEAIVALILQGGPQASAEANKVEVDLKSVKRAGEEAEGAAKKAGEAAKGAADASNQLAARAADATRALHRVAAAARALDHFVKGQSASADGIDRPSNVHALSEGLTDAAHAFTLTPGPLPLKLLAAAGAGLYGGIHSKHEQQDAYRKAKEAQSKALIEQMQKDWDENQKHNLDLRLLQEAGLLKLSHLTGGLQRNVQ
jgi:hypothetical protein